VFASLWLLFAPVQLGGTTSYAVTEGISMLPMLHTGNLAVVHTREAYGVGDAVLYNSPVLHRPVLHRVIAIDEGQYSLRGDNNDFTDPGTVPASAIVGKLWFHLPRVGGWVGWLTVPLHASLVAVAAVLILMLGGRAKRGRRARRRGRAARPEPQTVLPQSSTSRGATVQPVMPRDFVLKGVNLPRALRPLTALLAFALLVAAVGFAVPSHREAAEPGAFRQLGDFSYVSKLTAPNAAYPTGLAQTGDPLLLDLFHDVGLRFNYQFNTRLPHKIQGTIALNTVISASTSYHRTFALTKAVAFEGDSANIAGTVDLAASRAFFDQLSADSGSVGSDYQVGLQAVVHITGVVNGKPIHETFTPVLPFSFNHQLIKLAVPASTAAGSDFTAPTSGLAAVLNPEQTGSVTHRVRNAVTVLRFHFDVAKMRILGLVLAALTFMSMILLLIARPPIKARREQDLIAKRYGALLVPVVSVNPEGRVTIELPDFHSLARLAQHYEHLVLVEQQGRVATYAVDEDGRLYVYRIARTGGPEMRGRGPETGVPRPAVAAATRPPEPTAKRRPQLDTPPVTGNMRAPVAPGREGVLVSASARKLVRPAGVIGLLVVCLSVVTGFTATNTVPVTHAGKSAQALSYAQLTPTVCASIAIDNGQLMPVTANSATGTSDNDLILGANRTGTVNYNGKSGDDCIVAGGRAGTTNIIDGGSGTLDICIGAPGANNTFKNCDRTYN
jgi:signal peptidase I